MGNAQGFRRRSMHVLLANLLAAAAAFGTAILTARLLGAAGRGQYSLATVLATLTLTLGNLGTGSAAAYHAARGRYPRRVIVGWSVLAAASIGLVCAGAAFVLVLAADQVLSGVPNQYVALALAAVPFGLVVVNLQNVLLGLERFPDFNVLTVAQAALPFFLVAVTVGLLGAGVRGAIGATLASSIVLAVGSLAWCGRLAGGVAWSLHRTYAKEAGSYGLKAHASNVLAFLGYRLDVFLINGFLNPAAVGLYTVAVATVERLWMLSQAASTVLFPRIAAEHDEAVRKAVTPVVSRNVLWLTALAALALYGVSDWLVRFLYTSEFEGSVRPLQILLPGVVVFSAARVLVNDIAARGRPLTNSAIAGTSLLVNIALNVVLIPPYGLEGAAWATTASYSALFAATIGFYCSISGNRPLSIVVLRRSDLSIWFEALRTIVNRLHAHAPVRR